MKILFTKENLNSNNCLEQGRKSTSNKVLISNLSNSSTLGPSERRSETREREREREIQHITIENDENNKTSYEV